MYLCIYECIFVREYRCIYVWVDLCMGRFMYTRMGVNMYRCVRQRKRGMKLLGTLSHTYVSIAAKS